MSDSGYVRVRQHNGRIATLRSTDPAVAELEVLDRPAVDNLGNPLPDKAPQVLQPAGYGSWKKAELTDELARRNSTRGEDDQIVPAGSTNPDLAAALEADDHNNTDGEES